jgi:CheY-like chemotaxis protein
MKVSQTRFDGEVVRSTRLLQRLPPTKTADGYPQPDIVFLDINMPVMNKWEFPPSLREASRNSARMSSSSC